MLVAIPTENRKAREGVILAMLTGGAAMLAALMLHRGTTTRLEAVSFVSGAVCVWLAVRESVWNFPIGILNVAVFFVIFLRARLYADAGLQLVYVVLGFVGWYLWLFGGTGRGVLRVTLASNARRVRVALAGVLMWIAMYWVLRSVGGAVPLLDALTTSLSLCAQWLLDRKHFENWFIWIVADVIYIPLYLSRGLTLTALLYAVFLCMCLVGMRQWHASMRAAAAREAA